MRMLLLTAILLFSGLSGSSVRSQSTNKDLLVSPRLTRLRRDVEAGNRSALESFWQDIAKQGAPLVESIQGEERNLLVTFLWRSKEAANVVIMCDFGANVRSRILTRLGSTDVWYKIYRMPNDARFLYQLSVDDPSFPF